MERHVGEQASPHATWSMIMKSTGGGRLEGSGCDKAFKGQKDNECVNCKTSFWKTVDNLGEI